MIAAMTISCRLSQRRRYKVAFEHPARRATSSNDSASNPDHVHHRREDRGGFLVLVPWTAALSWSGRYRLGFLVPPGTYCITTPSAGAGLMWSDISL